MTLLCLSHLHVSPLIQNTPFDLFSSNPKPWNTSSKGTTHLSVELVKHPVKSQIVCLHFIYIATANSVRFLPFL
jgi:hypothetical protein